MITNPLIAALLTFAAITGTGWFAVYATWHYHYAKRTRQRYPR